jgi:hypothetical protein
VDGGRGEFDPEAMICVVSVRVSVLGSFDLAVCGGGLVGDGVLALHSQHTLCHVQAASTREGR